MLGLSWDAWSVCDAHASLGMARGPCSFSHSTQTSVPSPSTLYLHKGVEALVPEALPVCCCLKVQLVGASLGLPWSQEGLAAAILIRAPAGEAASPAAVLSITRGPPQPWCEG